MNVQNYDNISIEEYLYNSNLKRNSILGDGNCLFRALADQLNWDTNTYYELRQNICLYMRYNSEYFSKFVSNQTFEEYLNEMSQDACWGDNLCIQAFADLYLAKIIIIEIVNNQIREILIEPRFHRNFNNLKVIYLLFDGLHYDSLKPINSDYLQHSSLH